jgi:hypothetical protein
LPAHSAARFQLAAFDGKSPSQALAQLGSLKVTELELTSFGGEQFYIASYGRRETRIVPINGEPMPEFPKGRIVEIVRKAIGSGNVAELRAKGRIRFLLSGPA